MDINLVNARKLDQEIANLLTSSSKFGLRETISVHNVDALAVEEDTKFWDELFSKFSTQNAKYMDLVQLRYSIRHDIGVQNHISGINEILNDIGLNKQRLARVTSIVNVCAASDKVTDMRHASRALETLRTSENGVSRFHHENSVTLYPINNELIKGCESKVVKLKRHISNQESALVDLNHSTKIKISELDVTLLTSVHLV